MPRRVPPDVAAVLETFAQLGDAARRALWLAERRTESEVKEAARRASLLGRQLKR